MSKEALKQASGAAVLGYRAPTFSLVRQTAGALDVLGEMGLLYDSSIYPVRHDRYGIPDAPRGLFMAQGARHEILEIPPATLSVRGVNVPVGGGGYFRLLPLATLLFAIRHRATSGGPFTAYFHPYEFDLEPLRLSVRMEGIRRFLRSQLFQQHQNLRRRSLPGKLRRIMAECRIETCEEFVARLMRQQTDAAGFPAGNYECKPI